MNKEGVLLVNLGTPDSPKTTDVRKYLREFLMDPRVIDIPYWRRFLLVQGIIAPFRAPQSAKVYSELWTEKGSPLLLHGQSVQRLLQEELGENYTVVLGMRYQNPSIKSALELLKNKGLKKITVIPMYPQYAESSSGSSIEEVLNTLRQWRNIPELNIISHFPQEELFIQSFAEIGQKYLNQKEYDHVLFTYHGVPERQIRKAAVDQYCQINAKCCSNYNEKNKYCYRAQCYATTRALVRKLGIADDKHTVSFQSRLGRTPWIKPYTDEVIKELAQKGIKRILAFSPSFVADCLETTVEIGREYHELFVENGGQELELVHSLNSYPLWIQCLKKLVCAKNSALTNSF